MLNKKAIRIALAAAAVALVAGCGAEEGSRGSQPADGNASAGAAQQGQQRHNQADIAFAQGMIPHHQQAIEMADMVQGRSRNTQVIELAMQIKNGQDPEITAMQGWLRQWGAQQPKPMNGGGMGSMDNGGMNGSGMGGMDHGGPGMSGMMSGQQMTQLRNAKGAAFDRMWLQMMIEHHKSAVEMSTKEQRAGASPDAKKLAGAIIDTQRREIATMNGLLG